MVVADPPLRQGDLIKGWYCLLLQNQDRLFLVRPLKGATAADLPVLIISQVRAATRSARAVFLSSAPLAGRPNAGLAGTGLRLACAEPGDDELSIFGDALRELSERATYLYRSGHRSR